MITNSTYPYSPLGFIVLSIVGDAKRLDVSKKLTTIARWVDSLEVMKSIVVH